MGKRSALLRNFLSARQIISAVDLVDKTSHENKLSIDRLIGEAVRFKLAPPGEELP